MKIRLSLLAAVFSIVLAIIFVQCSDESAKPTFETPLSKFIAGGTWSYTQINDLVDRSIGNKFSVHKNGDVVALGIASPVAGTFDVALYEVAVGNTPTLIGSTSVEITQTEVDSDPEAFKYASLDAPVFITTGKTYCVAYTTNGNKLNRLDQPGFDLPIRLSNSQVSIEVGAYGTADSFPENDQSGVIFMADVKFKY